MNTEKITVTFTPSEPKTQFEAGAVSVIATGRESILDLASRFHLNLNPEKTVAAIMENRLEWTDPKPCFRIEASLDHEFMEPYFSALEKLSGMERTRARTAEIPIPGKPNAITHYKLSQFVNHGHFCYDYAVHDYKAKDAEPEEKRFAYAQKCALRCAENTITWREPVREYIETGTGLFKRNPLYATGRENPAKPGIVCKELWQALVSWWLQNEATPLQRAAAEMMMAADKKGRITDNGFGLSYGGGTWYLGYSFYLPDTENGTCDYTGRGDDMRRVVKCFSETELSGWNPEKNRVAA